MSVSRLSIAKYLCRLNVEKNVSDVKTQHSEGRGRLHRESKSSDIVGHLFPSLSFLLFIYDSPSVCLMSFRMFVFLCVYLLSSYLFVLLDVSLSVLHLYRPIYVFLTICLL